MFSTHTHVPIKAGLCKAYAGISAPPRPGSSLWRFVGPFFPRSLFQWLAPLRTFPPHGANKAGTAAVKPKDDVASVGFWTR